MKVLKFHDKPQIPVNYRSHMFVLDLCLYIKDATNLIFVRCYVFIQPKKKTVLVSAHAQNCLSWNLYKKSRTWETLNFSTDADRSTDTKTDKNGQRFLIYFFEKKKKKKIWGGGGFPGFWVSEVPRQTDRQADMATLWLNRPQDCYTYRW